MAEGRAQEVGQGLEKKSDYCGEGGGMSLLV